LLTKLEPHERSDPHPRLCRVRHLPLVWRAHNKVMEESRFVSVKCKLETYGQEITMAGSDTPFPLSEMMTQGFEQTRKAMENYFDFFEKNQSRAMA
jgi:hypothetical protein